ncbi:MAG TPA: M20/M25/M40 family metallo-hydrolase [Gemmatimonas sp.]|uniref:M20/M25/M40 family metallo-hydrolase n=1 Tax=Gemmatimonas sp. TaxID=1962908 RepID=UPI002ED7C298
MTSRLSLVPRPLLGALALGLAVSASGPSRLSAQAPATSPASDPTLKRLWTLGMDSSHVERLAQALLDSIGPRLTGTARQKAANDWLLSLYKQWGVEGKNEQIGTWRGWRRGHSHIDLLTPRVRSLEGTMLAWSPGTGSKDLTAGVVVLPRFADSTEFVKWLPQAKGKFVLVSAPQPTCRPTDNWQQHATPASKARMDSLRAAVNTEWGGISVRGTGYSNALGTGSLGVRLEEGGVAGVISSRPKNAWGTIDVFESYNTKAPAIALSCEDYGLVFRLAENKQSPTVRLNLDAALLGEQPIFNTIGMIKGTEKPNEYVVLSAHFDSFDGGSGATDNGTGSLTMLEAMRLLATVYPKPKRTILIGHWTAEEHGLVGSRAFTEDHPEVVQGLQALFNQDGGTGRVQSVNAGGLVDAGAHLRQWIAAMPTEVSSVLTPRIPGAPSGGGSDDASFACHGAPAFGLGGIGWDYGSYTWHTNRDTYDKVVFDDLRWNATVTAMLAYLAANDATTITRERATAEQIRPQGNAAAAGGGGAFAWPTCQKAPRKTNPRLR